MPQLTIPDRVYEILRDRAAALDMTVEQLVIPILDRAATQGVDPGDKARDRSAAFAKWMSDVSSRAERYPDGFVLDDRRETIYERDGE